MLQRCIRLYPSALCNISDKSFQSSLRESMTSPFRLYNTSTIDRVQLVYSTEEINIRSQFIYFILELFLYPVKSLFSTAYLTQKPSTPKQSAVAPPPLILVGVCCALSRVYDPAWRVSLRVTRISNYPVLHLVVVSGVRTRCSR